MHTRNCTSGCKVSLPQSWPVFANEADGKQFTIENILVLHHPYECIYVLNTSSCYCPINISRMIFFLVSEYTVLCLKSSVVHRCFLAGWFYQCVGEESGMTPWCAQSHSECGTLFEGSAQIALWRFQICFASVYYIFRYCSKGHRKKKNIKGDVFVNWVVVAL